MGVGVVFVRGGSVFLAKRRGAHGADTWASAGGHLESGETLEDCARREAWEELGLRVGDVRYLCLNNIIAYGKHYVDVEFAGDIGDQEPTLVEPDRFAESGWFDLDHLETISKVPCSLVGAVRMVVSVTWTSILSHRDQGRCFEIVSYPNPCSKPFGMPWTASRPGETTIPASDGARRVMRVFDSRAGAALPDRRR